MRGKKKTKKTTLTLRVATLIYRGEYEDSAVVVDGNLVCVGMMRWI